MSANQYENSFAAWLNEHMKLGREDKPSRIVVVMAALERLLENPSLQREEHLTDSKMQLIEHNRYVARALERCGIDSPVQAFGRRSSNLGGWIGPLFKWIESQGFTAMESCERESFLTSIESIAAGRLQIINEGKPLIARYNKGTVVAVIADILDQAQEKKRAKDVAEYLVGAKLQVKFGESAAEPKNVNTPNRDRPADFRFGNAAIEVTVNAPDPRHLSQIDRIVKDTALDVWLLVRRSDREKWQNAVDATVDEQLRGRVVVADIETFVGQNMSEIGEFKPRVVEVTLTELFRVYNERWLPSAGGSGLRIVRMDSDRNCHEAESLN